VKSRSEAAEGRAASQELLDSWSLSHLGYIYPETTPVVIKRGTGQAKACLEAADAADI